MLKKYLVLFSILLFIGFLFIDSLSFALSNKQKWLILEQFKRDEYEMIFETDIWLLEDEDRDVFNISNKINIYENIRSKATDKKKYAELQHENIVSKVISLEETVKEMDEDIEEKAKEINKINAKVIEVKDKIVSNKKIINLLRKKIEEHRKILLDYMIYIYKKWNFVSYENNIDNLKTIILSDQNISDIIDDLHFKWIVEITWKKLIDEHRGYVSELYVKKVELEKQEINYKKLRKVSIVEKKVLNDKKKFKEKILKEFKWKQVLYEKFIKDKIKIEKKIVLKQLKEKIKFKNVRKKLLEKYNCEFVDVSKNTVESRSLSERCLSINKMIYSESQLKWFNATWNNIFSWPVFPSNWISAYFHDGSYKELFWSSHDAIDIPTSQWTSIRAPADGYVIYIEKPVSEDYAYIALKHSDWFVTVYWHVSEVLVDELDFVKAWDIFAKTWWEYWTTWAWIMTTWPHLHFEVFRDKQYVDPINFLDISILPFEFIPSKYEFKFYSDFKDRKWYEYKNKKEKSKFFSLDWETEVERQKKLISKYAVWSFRNWHMWVEESLDWNIDPTFVMCIWLAETWLGKNMKTAYNVWNVWNTDSWATRSLKNARSWVYYIVRTLNNKLLGRYNSINKLSCYGNREAKLCDPKKPVWDFVYASSPDHRHNNIIKCMSVVKWRYVEDDYNFRLIR